MRIIIVEDDYLQADWLEEILKENLSSPGTDVISTEHEFRARMDEFRKNPPDLILLDVMLRWTDPGPDNPPAPEDVRESGFFLAGFRCERLLREREETRDVPVVLYTVLLQEDLGEKLHDVSPKTVYVEKVSDPDGLLAAIKRLIHPS